MHYAVKGKIKRNVKKQKFKFVLIYIHIYIYIKIRAFEFNKCDSIVCIQSVPVDEWRASLTDKGNIVREFIIKIFNQYRWHCSRIKAVNCHEKFYRNSHVDYICNFIAYMYLFPNPYYERAAFACSVQINYHSHQ